MQLKKAGNIFTQVREEEFFLSGKALAELMEATLAKGVNFRFLARGFSMLPFVRDNDILTITPLSRSLPGFGKVVAFVRPDNNNLVVHRIIGRKDGKYLIKGDCCPQSDGLIPEKNILGCICRIERNGKNVSFGLGREQFIIAVINKLDIPFFGFFILGKLLPLPAKNTLKRLLKWSQADE